ncbi:cytochrome P450 20A1-like [Ruditapes philippinarum]|uniref:cytochrome P450 20A1-like n=1 Tax=Ruditapes philippinarum TaxID=129788 RepID=UPI00295BF7FC|nr:cytochrome P450 20A1-like [Ruditapes philippinarum]
MLAFAIFAVTFVVSLICIVIYLYPSSKNPSTIPGLDPVSKEDGNLGDIAKAGSLHEFLMDLHKQFGSIASFWWGPTYVVSIANADLFKQHHNVFDRPLELFEMFEPLIGAKCIQYANGEDGRARRNLYDKCLTHGAINKYFMTFQEIADEMVKKWETMLNDQHIPLVQYMYAFALKAVLASLYGEKMKDDKAVLEFKAVYDAIWAELEHRLTEPPNETRKKIISDGKKKLAAIANEMVKHRKENPPEHGEELLLDLLLDYTDDEELQSADALVYVIGGFHTTGNLISWAIYFLATHPDCQEKVVKEIKNVLGDDDVDHTNMGELEYLRQVIDETLRCAVVAPWAARFQDFDSELGGHRIPKNTPVIHALGVASKDETVFPEPDKFDPNRFTHEHNRERSHFSFSPFGFAGKRICPGQKFAYTETTVALVTLLRKFKVKMVEGQIIEPVHGLVTHPSDEIWITISKRK